MKVYAVYEYMVIEYEERFRIMSIHSSEDSAKKAIVEYEEVAKKWKNRADYSLEEYEVDKSYYED